MQKLKLTLVLVFLFGLVFAAQAREVVAFDDAPAGMIIISTSERALYLTLGNNRALRYRVAVAKRGMRFCAIGSDMGFLRAGTRAQLDRLK